VRSNDDIIGNTYSRLELWNSIRLTAWRDQLISMNANRGAVMSAFDPKRTCYTRFQMFADDPERTSLCLGPVPTGGMVHLVGGRWGVMEWSSSEWRGA
jgi:hypothetical protein